MPANSKRPVFSTTEEGQETRLSLRLMADDTAFNTEPSYIAKGDLYPDHLIPFENKHMDFLDAHPSTDARQYLANLRLMTRLRR
jgi:hypothetical protein